VATGSLFLGTRAARRSLAERVRARPAPLMIGGLLALAVVLILGIGLGSVWISPDQTVAILVHRLLGIDLGIRWTPAAETIVVDLRLPRVLSAMVVGAGLAVAGATYQGLLRNPLAVPRT
jgi:iron complex transport system permease protein